MNKKAILHFIITQLEKDLELLVHAAIHARDSATDPESIAEDKYDTRGLEQAYLAGAQAKRAAEAKEYIHYLKNLKLKDFNQESVIDVSAFVELEAEDGEEKILFILPVRGGMKINFENREIFSISPDSPIAQALFEKTTGDQVEVRLSGTTKNYFIRSIC